MKALKYLLFVSIILILTLWSAKKFITQLPYNPYPFEDVATNEQLELFLKENIIPSNVYVHATNSPERLREYEMYYDKFEMDIFISKDNLDIYHYPEHSSIGFFLSDFFNIKNKKEKSKYWLDVKNLTLDNVDIIDGVLSKLIKGTNYVDKSDFLIESKNASALSKLSNMGYLTSFYLPSDYTHPLPCPNKSYTTQLLSQIEEHDIKIISFPYSGKETVKVCLITDDIDMIFLTWNGSVDKINVPDVMDYEMYIINHHLHESENTSAINKLNMRIKNIINKVLYNVSY